MELVPDGVLVEHILAHLSPSSLGDLCRLSEVSQRFRRLLEGTLSSYGRIVRRCVPNRQDMLNSAAFEGLRDLVFYCVRMGDSDWDRAMSGAAEGGHHDLVEYFVSMGATNWDSGMNRAARGGQSDLVEYFAAKGATWCNLYEFADYFKGATDLTSARWPRR